MVTASWISSILSGSAMRATPPSRRMSAGTRSSAMTAHAPASSAIRACSASVTSMITPPLSISARPPLTRMVPSSAISSILALRGAAKNGLHRPQGNPRLDELRLARGHALESESREQQRTRQPRARALDELPELHRQREREHGDGERSPQGDGQRPDLVGGEGDRCREGGEVRSAAEREARRTRAALPRLLEVAILDVGDRPMLRAVQGERPPAEE